MCVWLVGWIESKTTKDILTTDGISICSGIKGISKDRRETKWMLNKTFLPTTLCGVEDVMIVSSCSLSECCMNTNFFCENHHLLFSSKWKKPSIYVWWLLFQQIGEWWDKQMIWICFFISITKRRSLSDMKRFCVFKEELKMKCLCFMFLRC